MATVDKGMADKIAAGEYADDNPTRIVEYQNKWGGIAYGVTFGRDDINKYMYESDFITNPKVYWDA